MITDRLYNDIVLLLSNLVATISFSKEEKEAALLIEQFLKDRNVQTNRHLNNVWATNKYFDKNIPTILLNSHLDTVKPDPLYTKDPFKAIIEDDKLFGLGCNDAGASLVSLIATFLYFYDTPGLKYNLVLAATAEEEVSGPNGIETLLSILHPFDFAIVGEPTEMNLAIAEKGLLVLDCTVKGSAGHAALNEGENAIYKALPTIEWFKYYRFPKLSPWLGEVKMTVTGISTNNTQHNKIPSECTFMVDIRLTEQYTHQQILEIINYNLDCTVKPRSTRLSPSMIDIEHPIVKAGLKFGKETYGSATMSDAALMNVPVLKCGPGNSARSHTADEFIYLHEIKDGIETYIKMLEQII